jgi:hypothetical protein
MGINEIFHDGKLKVFFLSKEDYARYDALRVGGALRRNISWPSPFY